MTTRNFFALLLNRSIVGLTFYQALADLHQRLLLYMPHDKGNGCAQMMIAYLVRNQLHNVCNDPVAAAGLLAWSEDIQWREGWKESLVHCCGMYPQLREMAEFRDVNKYSRTVIERSHLELYVRIQEAEDRLAKFDLDDIWPTHTTQSPFTRGYFDYFRRFLLQFYEKAYRLWPPREMRYGYGPPGGWLTRNIVLKLQKDFTALYAYYVDRDIMWERAEHRGQPDRATCPQGSEASTRISKHDLEVANLFAIYDHKHKYSHIPFPLQSFRNQYQSMTAHVPSHRCLATGVRH